MITRRNFLNAMGAAAGAAAVASAGGPRRAEAGAKNTKTPRAGETKSCRLPARDVPVVGEYDVVVCGGGPSGITAALAARRAGLKVLLVESQGQLGGMGVSGMVSEWLGGDNGGLFHEFATEAVKRGIARISNWGPAFDPFAMAAYFDRKAAKAGLDVLLHTQAVDVRVAGGRITHVVIFNKSGVQAVSAKAVVDATGDADVAARSGCTVLKGRKEDGLMTPATLIFHVYNVDEKKLNAHFRKHGDRLLKQIASLQGRGQWPFPYNRFITRKLNADGVWMVNTIRLVGIDGTDGKSVSGGMIRGRGEAEKLMEIFRKHVPGYADARVKAVAPLLGVRETRRISGEYMMTLDDLAGWAADRKTLNDVIGYSTWGFDLPNPKRPSDNPGPKRRSLPKRKPIPYRVMVPRPIANLICPGRAISVERHILGSLRVASPCMAMGQAAGQAAAQVVRNNVPFARVDAGRLLKELKQAGVRIG